jgi:hypothetical protein
LLQSWTDTQARHLSDHLPIIADILPEHPPATAEQSSPKTENPAAGRASHPTRDAGSTSVPLRIENFRDYGKQVLTNCDCPLRATPESRKGFRQGGRLPHRTSLD